MARSLRSLRQVATLRHGHMARLFVPAFRVLGVCEHSWLGEIDKFIFPSLNGLRFDPVSQSDCRELYSGKYFLRWDFWNLIGRENLILFFFGLVTRHPSWVTQHSAELQSLTFGGVSAGSQSWNWSVHCNMYMYVFAWEESTEHKIQCETEWIIAQLNFNMSSKITREIIFCLKIRKMAWNWENTKM